jgi:dTDP-glucose pyrophosphorylase
MWGIVPAAGAGSRIQPLAFSKELLPVGSRFDGKIERPRAVSEYIVERMITAGATKICFVISPGKSDILEYYGASVGPARLCYVVQPQPLGLCDAVFCALPLVSPNEPVLVGLPDTIWFPENGLCALVADALSFLLFPVTRPELFDAVITDNEGRVREIRVKQTDCGSHWVWGAFKMPGTVLGDLHQIWCERGRRDEYIGTLVNAYIASGGQAWGMRAGRAYVDVGTLFGYREAIRLLSGGMEPTAANAATKITVNG